VKKAKLTTQSPNTKRADAYAKEATARIKAFIKKAKS